MTSNQSKTKVFIEIVNDLQAIIQQEGIRPGDKLPSERVLAERLGVGRSSVREALRSMELLGLIQTKHGGGTYLSDYRNHQLVEILGKFILPTESDIEHVFTTQRILERDAICTVVLEDDLRKLPVWDSLLHMVIEDQEIVREDIVREIIVAANNRLVYKMWLLLNQHAQRPYKGTSTAAEKVHLERFLSNLRMGQPTLALEAYEHWVEALVKERERNEHSRDF